MTQLAGLPMYDFAEIRSATDAFWLRVREELISRNITDAPLSLTRPNDLPGFWSDSKLLLGQTCGYPLMIGLCGEARYVATPHYKTRFSSGADHKSLIIAHRSSPIQTLADARNTICAINMADSNTGMNLLRLEVAKLKSPSPFFSRVYETLAHRKSMIAIATGEADIAAIDCVTFAHIERIDPALVNALKIIGETETTPNLPFITSANTNDATLSTLRDALQHVIREAPDRAITACLMIDDIEIIDNTAYERVRDIERRAAALGYPQLA